MGREIVVTLGNFFLLDHFSSNWLFEKATTKTTKTFASEGGALQLSHSRLLSNAVDHFPSFTEHLAPGLQSCSLSQILYNFPVPSVFARRICPTLWPWVFKLLISKELLPPLSHQFLWSHLAPCIPSSCSESETTR